MKKKPEKNPVALEEKKTFVNQNTRSPFLTKADILIIITIFISYCATLLNDYALDDFIVFIKNHFVQNGVSSIVNILSKDTFAGMSEANIMVFAGGRYRPLSLVTFAIEHQLFGNTPSVSHFINVLIYAFSGMMLFRVVKNIFKFNELQSLIIALVFVLLPIHSEPIINVKGRDDLMCFLFFLLSFLQLFDYQQSKKIVSLIGSVLFYLLSLFSKESGITFLVLFPLMLYFFSTTSFKKIIYTSIPYLIAALIFLMARHFATNHNPTNSPPTDVFNNPFVVMTKMQQYATILFSMLLYLKLIFYPVHLSYDYSYNQIPALDFNDWSVLCSIALHVVMIIVALYSFKRKSIYSFAILFYFITFSVFSNVFFSIGTLLAERFMLIPSLGICIIALKFYFDLIEKYLSNVSEKKRITISCIVPFVIIMMSSYRNIARCADWLNNHTLFIADVNSVPLNAKANLNAGLSYLEIGNLQQSVDRQQSFDAAKKYLLKGIAILPIFPDGYLNMGVIYNWELNYDSAEVWWDRARVVNPNSSKLTQYDKVLAQHFFQIGLKKGSEKNYTESITDLLKACRYDSLNADINYNIGGAYFSINDFANAKKYWEKTLQLNPDNKQAQAGLQAANQRIK